MFPDAHSRSARLFQRAQQVLAGGNTRYSVYTTPYQIYAARGAGSRIWDVDGVERLDLQNNMTVLIHGHAHPAVVERVCEQVERGSSFGLSTEWEIALAELLSARVPSFELVRFVNSGTEAVMTAIKAARAFTGRTKIAKAEGTYNGSYDYAEVSLNATPEDWGELDRPNSVAYARGTPHSVLDEVVVFPFNDPERALEILEEHKNELAAVLMDPLPARFGLLPATGEFLQAVRRFTQEAGILLIFDEVICFRLGYSGAQAEFACEPDLTALGKVIGGGFPVGALAGRREVMSVFDLSKPSPPIFQGGTFNANPVTMVAGLATMELLSEDAFAKLNALGELARAKATAAFRAAGVEGQVTGRGSLFRLHMTNRPLHDHRSAYPVGREKQQLDWLWRYFINHGVLLSKTCMGALATVTSESEITYFVETLSAALEAMKADAIAAQ